VHIYGINKTFNRGGHIHLAAQTFEQIGELLVFFQQFGGVGHAPETLFYEFANSGWCANKDS
jgi:hypothetical protein